MRFYEQTPIEEAIERGKVKKLPPRRPPSKILGEIRFVKPPPRPCEKYLKCGRIAVAGAELCEPCRSDLI